MMNIKPRKRVGIYAFGVLCLALLIPGAYYLLQAKRANLETDLTPAPLDAQAITNQFHPMPTPLDAEESPNLSLIHAPAAANAKEQNSAKYALLVGCTEYPNQDSFPTLIGPTNDVPAWERLLTSASPAGFGFPKDDVKVLLGKNSPKKDSPSLQNILRELDELIEKAQEGVHIFILLSGHGTQQPISDDRDPFDPKDPEPDGMDEVFLPADAEPGAKGIKNGLVDNVLGDKLNQMTSQGASVFIVFDCCHSGSMTRGPAGNEVNRFIPRHKTGIASAAFEAAANRAAQAAKGRPAAAADAEQLDGMLAGPSKAGRGSLVAFFAAQEFEPAPELPMPEGAANVPANRFGLLSYCLVQTLNQRRSPMSYRTLAQALATQYRDLRGTRFPTPFAEGDLDTEVLGMRKWPITNEIRLQRNDDELRITAGSLHGMCHEAVLAVYSPDKKLVGHVRVSSLFPTHATVEPCAWNELPRVEKLPLDGHCEVAYRDFGDLRLALYPGDDAMTRQAVQGLAEEVRSKLLLVEKQSLARWWLTRVSPEEAKQLGLNDPSADRILLLQGDASISASPTQADERLNTLKATKILGDYPADEEKLRAGLSIDLPRVFTWQNMWRVAHGLNAMYSGQTHDLIVTPSLLENKNDQRGKKFSRGIVKNGQYLQFKIRNDGYEEMWIAAFYLDANLGITQVIPTRQIPASRDLQPLVMEMSTKDDSRGQEGIIFFALPVGKDKTPPDYSIVEQPPFHVHRDFKRSPDRELKTPFGKLLKAISLGGEGTRGAAVVTSSTPTAFSQSWLLTD